MYLCLCKAVTYRTARELVRRGAHTPEALARACGAGTGCGTCREEAERLVGEVRLEMERSRELPLAAK